MKKIIISLSVIAIVAGISFGATGAFFQDTAKSTNNVFKTTSADLKISKGHGYKDSVEGFNAEKIYPGWDSGDDYKIWLKNESPADMTLEVIPTLERKSGIWSAYDEIRLQFQKAGGDAIGDEHTLDWWRGNDWAFPQTLNKGQAKGPFVLHFSMPYKEEDQNWIQNKTLNFDLSFNGIQLPQ